MHLLTDNEISLMPMDELRSKLENAGEASDSTSCAELQHKLKSLQRSRSLVLWHDHSTILGAGYILMTIHVLYDPADFCSSAEYETKTGEKCFRSIQEITEEPEIYILCLSSSSPSDQLAAISDRLDCLPTLQTPVISDSGVEVHDKMHFFIGDHPAQAFERGSQGGNYKCGSCGCLSSRMDDLAHSFTCSWRSLGDLQSLIIQGKYGSKPGLLKPFEKLKKVDLLEELHTRGIPHINNLDKKELTSTMVSILRGAQRVPTLLLTNPTQPLSELNLNAYTVLDCEPLHDLKGHLINLLSCHIFLKVL